MKCVQVVGQGIPTRMSDDDAFVMVHLLGDGQYCPKSVWRKHVAHMATLSAQYPDYSGYSKLTKSDHEWLRKKGLR